MMTSTRTAVIVLLDTRETTARQVCATRVLFNTYVLRGSMFCSITTSTSLCWKSTVLEVLARCYDEDSVNICRIYICKTVLNIEIYSFCNSVRYLKKGFL